jgi:RING finger/CHY zinc finger protein 1
MMCFSNYGCPICGEAMVDMHSVWGQLDEEVANCPMPEEYKDYYVQILCKDCHKVMYIKLSLK